MKYMHNSRGSSKIAIWIGTISTELEQLSKGGVLHLFLHVQLGSTFSAGRSATVLSFLHLRMC
eukprot:9062567-Prorocentrum_lima.AAC.1